MSGLWLLMVLGVWGWITWLLLKFWRRWRQEERGNRRMRDGIALVVGMGWLCVSFWYGGGQKIYYDAQVNRLCAKDGGIKMFETVRLPPDRFDKYGQINFYNPTQKENALGPEYIFKSETRYYKQGNPEMSRSHYLIHRRSDDKLLGETISYGRGGGDLPGPWHGSSFSCPEISKAGPNALLQAVFVMNTTSRKD
jgi:hypothetical protein